MYPQDKLNTAGLKAGIQGKWMDGWATEGRFNWKVALRKFVFPINSSPHHEVRSGLNTDTYALYLDSNFDAIHP